MALKCVHVTCNYFPWNKAGDFGTPTPTEIRLKLHAQENAQSTLLPNKEILKLKKMLEGHELLVCKCHLLHAYVSGSIEAMIG